MKLEHLKIILIIFTILIFSVIGYYFYYHTYVNPYYIPRYKGIPPFEYKAVKLAVKEASMAWVKRGYRLHLPTWLPIGYKLTAIYGTKHDGKIGLFMMITYSDDGDDSTPSAEIVIEVSPAPMDIDSLIENHYLVIGPENSKRVVIGNWTVYYGYVPCAWDEYYLKYGTRRSLDIELVIDHVLYSFRIAPEITLWEALRMIESMRPVM